MIASPQIQRIKQELKMVGVTSFGLVKFTSKYLPAVLHPDEHIKGAVYGRYTEGTGLLQWVEGMLVATDKRILFIDHKPGFSKVDELTYDVISGVKKVYTWPFSSMTLHTRLGDYLVRFANAKCIDIFVQYIEARRLEANTNHDGAVAYERIL